MDKSVLKTIIADNMAGIPNYRVNLRNFHFENAGNYVFVV